MASDVAVCDWLRCPGNDVQLHLVVVIRYKSAERSHVQLQFHPDFQREKVRTLAPQPSDRKRSTFQNLTPTAVRSAQLQKFNF